MARLRRCSREIIVATMLTVAAAIALVTALRQEPPVTASAIDPAIVSRPATN